MKTENQNEIKDNNIKDSKIEKENHISSFTQLNEKEQNVSRTNQNLINLQNSACKNLKNDVKSESANNFM